MRRGEGQVEDVKAHRCIGGPLDGEYATSEDFLGYRQINPETKKPYIYHQARAAGTNAWKRDEGMYQHLKGEYMQFNTARHGNAASDVVWIHSSLLTGSISPKSR